MVIFKEFKYCKYYS